MIVGRHIVCLWIRKCSTAITLALSCHALLYGIIWSLQCSIGTVAAVQPRWVHYPPPIRYCCQLLSETIQIDSYASIIMQSSVKQLMFFTESLSSGTLSPKQHKQGNHPWLRGFLMCQINKGCNSANLTWNWKWTPQTVWSWVPTTLNPTLTLSSVLFQLGFDIILQRVAYVRFGIQKKEESHELWQHLCLIVHQFMIWDQFLDEEYFAC